MGRLGITFADVKKAITTLQGQQRTVTVDNIREVLGTGSKSTISRLLKEWRHNQSPSYAEESPLPAELLTLIESFWAHMQTQAQQQANTAREHFEASTQQLLQQIAQLQAEAASLNQQLDGANTTLTNTDIKLQTTTRELQQATYAYEKLSSQYQLAGEHYQALEQNHQQLNQHLKNVQLNLEHYQQAELQLRQEQSRQLDNERLAHQHKIEQLQKTLHGNEKELLCLEQKNQHQHAIYQQLLTTHQHTNTELETLTKKYDALNVQYQQTKQQLTVQSQQVAHLQTLLTSKNANIELLTQASKQEHLQIKQLEETIFSLKEKLDFILEKQEKSLQV